MMRHTLAGHQHFGTYGIIARAMKVNTLVNSLATDHVSSKKARSMTEEEWRERAKALRITKPSETAVQEVCAQLEGFERPAERISA